MYVYVYTYMLTHTHKHTHTHMHELQITHIYACPTNHKFQSNKNMCTWTSRDLHKNVHTGVIHDDPKTEK